MLKYVNQMKKVILLLLSIITHQAYGQVIFRESGQVKAKNDTIGQAELEVTYMGRLLPRANQSFMEHTENNRQLSNTVIKDSVNKLRDSLFVLIAQDSLQLLDIKLSKISNYKYLKVHAFYRNVPSILPVRVRSMDDFRVSSGFGMRWHPIREKLHNHSGIDLPRPLNTPVYATADGIVDKIVWQPEGLGLAIYLKHTSGYTTVYGHLAHCMVRHGEPIERGAEIGLVGSTGVSTGPHLHYSVLDRGVPVDPGDFCFLLMRAIQQTNELTKALTRK